MAVLKLTAQSEPRRELAQQPGSHFCSGCFELEIVGWEEVSFGSVVCEGQWQGRGLGTPET